MVSFVRNHQSGCTILYSHQQWMSFYCSISSPAFDVVSVSIFAHSKIYVMESQCCLNFHSHDDIWCGTFFHVPIANWISFWVRYLLQFLAHFLVRFVFLLLKFKSFPFFFCGSESWLELGIFFPQASLALIIGFRLWLASFPWNQTLLRRVPWHISKWFLLPFSAESRKGYSLILTKGI